jgi:hypothetical protein
MIEFQEGIIRIMFQDTHQQRKKNSFVHRVLQII